jgi:alcohol dehydrogenase
MRALVYARPNEVQLQERPMPRAAPGEVVLAIEAVGICGSDMHAWHGHDPRRQPGLVLGHEFVGRIVAAALTEPAATAWHASNLTMRALARPLHECRVLVIGGAIGMLAALLLRHPGVHRVTLAELNALRRGAVALHVRCETIDPLHTAPAEASFEVVIDAVGAKATRTQALAAVKPGGVVMHVGLQDWASEIDMRKLTLAEITLLGTYPYTTADLRATVAALAEGAFGDLGWVQERPLDEGQQAFVDLDQGRCAAAKVLLRP